MLTDEIPDVPSAFAIALIVCAPFATLDAFQLHEYGALVSVQIVVPSIWKTTLSIL